MEEDQRSAYALTSRGRQQGRNHYATRPHRLGDARASATRWPRDNGSVPGGDAMQIGVVRNSGVITTAALAIAMSACATLFWVGDGQLVCRVTVRDHTELVAVNDQNGNIVMAQNQSPEFLASVCGALHGTPAPAPASGVATVQAVDLSNATIPQDAVKPPRAVPPQIVVQGRAPTAGTPPVTGSAAHGS